MVALPHFDSAEESVSVFAERLLEAIQRLSDLKELGVADPDDFARFIEQVGAGASTLCPESIRGRFVDRLTGLSRGLDRTQTKLHIARGRSESERRFEFILAHLPARIASLTARDTTAAHLVTLATEIVQDKEEWKKLIARIPPIPGNERSNVFLILSRAIASWDLASATYEDVPAAVCAMRKILAFSGDAQERAKRVRDLVMTAVSKLGEGEIMAAAWILEVVQESLAEEPLHATVIERIRADALMQLEDGPFTRLLEDTARHPLLCRVFAFFPAIARESLLEQLKDRKPERIDLVRGLLAAWGLSAQTAILAQLDTELRKHEIDRPYVIDLLNLLARISRTPDAEDERELAVLARASAPGQPAEVVQAAVRAIASVKTSAAERLLTRRLAEYEAIPFRNDRSFYSRSELHEMLDVIVEALAPFATQAAIRAIVRHGLGHGVRFSDTRMRLRFLRSTDLSVDPESVSRLCAVIREDLPVVVLGRAVTNRAHSPAPLIEALRATRNEEAEQLLKEIAARHPEFRASIRRSADAAAGPNRTGTLDYFSLPSLLQSCIDRRATGLLSLADATEEIRARIWFDAGRLVYVTTRQLEGLEAFYQLFERPNVGSYAFAPRAVPENVRRHDPIDFPTAFREAARRHDDLHLLSAIAPEDAVIGATSMQPSPLRDERDPQFLRSVWLSASSGRTVAEWESTLPGDSWRVRSIVARWLEEGSLEIRNSG